MHSYIYIGNIVAFKKGPFYMWETLNKIPIIPMVVLGAYELYPPGSNLSHCGKVYCHYLTPIISTSNSGGGGDSDDSNISNSSDSSDGDGGDNSVSGSNTNNNNTNNTNYTREEVSIQLRRQMLSDIVNNSPTDIASNISWSARIYCNIVIITIHSLNLYICWYFYKFFILPNITTTNASNSINSGSNANTIGSELEFQQGTTTTTNTTNTTITLFQATINAYSKLIGIVILISLLNYIYCVYIKARLMKYINKINNKDSSSGKDSSNNNKKKEQ